MYENEIENLEHLQTVVGPSAAIDAAIALMRATQGATDEAAEREHCRATFERDMRPLSGVQPMHTEFLMRERAAARAEGRQAALRDIGNRAPFGESELARCMAENADVCAELHALRKDVADWKRRAEQAERELAVSHASHEDTCGETHDLRKALAAVEAELADWKKRTESLGEQFVAQSTRAGLLETNLADVQNRVAELDKELKYQKIQTQHARESYHSASRTLEPSLIRDVEKTNEIVKISTDLAIARAEIEKHQKYLEASRQTGLDIADQLAAAQAEIARSEGFRAALCIENDELETKLANILRAAANYRATVQNMDWEVSDANAAEQRELEQADDNLCAAINASKK